MLIQTALIGRGVSQGQAAPWRSAEIFPSCSSACFEAAPLGAFIGSTAESFAARGSCKRGDRAAPAQPALWPFEIVVALEPANYDNNLFPAGLNSAVMETFWREGSADFSRTIAYFSMEIGFDPRIPTYSGGLGILAGDTLKACADLCIPVVGITLLSEKGYFLQRIDVGGNQIELENPWQINELLTLLPVAVKVRAEGREILVQAWEGIISTHCGCDVPVYYLDTNLDGNSDYDRTITSYLYGGDRRYRILQEVVLGLGGVKMLAALGFKGIERYHLNEGHTAFLILELLKTHARGRQHGGIEECFDVEAVKRQCVFTTHTPVPAGHDVFEPALVHSVLGEYFPVQQLAQCYHEGAFNMTLLALNFSYYCNAVSKMHGEVTPAMFPGYPMDSITNGVHLPTWIADEFHELFDKYAAGWVREPDSLRSLISAPEPEIWAAHAAAKRRLINFVNSQSDVGMEEGVFTIGFARRATPYKRATLIFRDLAELVRINGSAGPLQIVFGGKAHPQDAAGKKIISEVFQVIERLRGSIKVAFLENYDMYLGKLLTSGVDIWLNTPLRPLEASGTSGMKAAANGVPNLSVLDGWWVEGCIEGLTGWGIGPPPGCGLPDSDDAQDAQDMLHKLESEILPCYYRDRRRWIQIMKNSIVFNAPVFNTVRMVYQYITHAYFLGISGFVVGRGTLGCVWIRGSAPGSRLH